MEERNKFFSKLVTGLKKTRENMAAGLGSIFSGFTSIDGDFYDELEESLIAGDIGVKTAESIIDELKERVRTGKIKDPKEARQILISCMEEQMSPDDNLYDFENKRSVVLFTGVNGVGKTTSIGKLAYRLKNNGKKVVIAAADTFRAAASDQLKIWADRLQADFVAGQEGADPGSVLFDAIASAKRKNADILLCDTAGRLHNKKNLMEELKKLDRIIDREYKEACRENLLVLDASCGQNAIVQAEQFTEATRVTGIVLTKMDGTARGGVAVGIRSELGIPVKYIGVGEQIDDLQKFNAHDFIAAMFDQQ